MNNVILTLEKRKVKVMKLRSCYIHSCDYESIGYEFAIRKFDSVLDAISKRIRNEWNKQYKPNRNEKEIAQHL